jgi:hypothetical protein
LGELKLDGMIKGLLDTGWEFNRDRIGYNMEFMWDMLINPWVSSKTGKLLGFLR